MVFEKDENGLLHQVSEEAAQGRRYHRVVGPYDVLFSAEEEAEREAHDRASEAEAMAKEAAKAAKPPLTLEQKLASVGVTLEELREALK